VIVDGGKFVFLKKHGGMHNCEGDGGGEKVPKIFPYVITENNNDLRS